MTIIGFVVVKFRILKFVEEMRNTSTHLPDKQLPSGQSMTRDYLTLRLSNQKAIQKDILPLWSRPTDQAMEMTKLTTPVSYFWLTVQEISTKSPYLVAHSNRSESLFPSLCIEFYIIKLTGSLIHRPIEIMTSDKSDFADWFTGHINVQEISVNQFLLLSGEFKTHWG